MRILVVTLLLALVGQAHAQLPVTKNAGLNEFSRLCLAHDNLDFTLSEADRLRLGLEKDPNVSVIPDDEAEKYKIPKNKRTTIIRWGRMIHGAANDPSTFSVWRLPRKSMATVQTVDEGRAMFGMPDNQFPAHFCSILTVGDAKDAWQAFGSAADNAVLLSEENTESLLYGPKRTWLIELPLLPDQVGVVTIASSDSPYMQGPNVIHATTFCLEVVPFADLQRLFETASDRQGPP